MKKWIVITLLGSLLISAQVNAKTPRPGPGPQGMALMHALKSLSLTKAQRQSVRELMRDFRETHDLSPTTEPPAMADDKTADLPLTAITERATAHWQKMKSQRIEMASLEHDIWSLLTDEQKQQYENRASDKKGKFKARRHPRNTDGLGMPFDELALTAQQTESLTALIDAQRANDESAREMLRALHEEIEAQVYNDDFNETALETLIDSYQDVFISDAAGRAQTHKKIMALLTDEQKEDLQDIRFFSGPKPGEHRPHAEK
ncbi:Spy/CpxP family protein refolding chaperone [Alteromonas sp. C1M14]|uniref:Spy/CpxP family protein refolding chaperone n=1 Tax=Alteromonas sp. C1M14 TaxID=2841567 RepID=UPI001C0A19EE|nr:Spy/CpxP family protein refolding chaperone [Alteromonas sp. C1M14]MBU2978658.1 Spy/CpxP family protein refolding chaperone [Alteromonas sp. C1M14]